jgi:hypothetical protein
MRVREEVYSGVWWANLRERDQLDDPGIGGRIIKLDLQEVGSGDMDWINLAQDRNSWWALVNAVINLQVP